MRSAGTRARENQLRIDLSAAEGAERVGVTRVTGCRYLDDLVRRGLVGLSTRYGSQGRPEHRYRCVDAVG